MAKFCGNCGKQLNDTAAFCGGCGIPVLGGTAPAPKPAAVPTPPIYTPQPVSPASSEPAFTPVEVFTPAPYSAPAATLAPSAPAFTPVEVPTPQAYSAPAATPVSPAPAFTPVEVFTPPAYSAPAATPVSPAPGFTPVAGYTPGPVVPPAKQSNTLLKVLAVCVVLLVVGTALAAAGMWYAAQKIKEKATAAASQAAAQNPGLASVLGAVKDLGKSAATEDGPTEFKGNPCRFLSTQEVSQAIGVPIVRAEGENNGCTYIAKGDPAQMTAKHMSAMTAGLTGGNMDPKTKKMIEGFAGGLFAQQEKQDAGLSAEAAKQEVPVLVLDFEVGNAQATMKLNRSSFRYVTGGGGSAKSSGTGDLDGIGDEAYLAGGSMLMVRKGDTIARFAYTGCPCSTDNIKPLAKLTASRM